MLLQLLKNFCRIQFLICVSKNNYDLEIIPKGSQDYDKSNHQMFLQNPVEPLGFLLPTEYEEVQQIILCARRHSLPISILAGGHSFLKHGYGSNDHWVLSLRKMNNITINATSSTAKVGSGVRTDVLRSYLWENGQYGLPYGGCSSVGVAGLTLGGGIGRTSRKHGLMSDRVVEMDVALANGTILTVNDKEHANLFWALRGAGTAGFGVVLTFTFSIFKADYPNYFMRENISVADFGQIFRLWQRWMASNPDPSFGSYLWFSILEEQENSQVEFTISEENSVKREQLLTQLKQEFYFLENATVHSTNYKDIFYEWSDDVSYYKTKSFFVSKEMNDSTVDTLEAAFSDSLPLVSIVFESTGGKISELRRNTTAYVHRDSAFHAFVGVSTPTLTLAVPSYKAMDILYESIVFVANGEAYQNTPDYDLLPWAKEYYAENLEKLIRIKRLYDRSNFFRHSQTIWSD